MKDYRVLAQVVTTYELEVKANSGADLLKYPKSASDLPRQVVFELENLPRTGKVVDHYVQVIEAVDLDESLGITESVVDLLDKELSVE
jgi:hypothetical protein